MVVVGGGDGAAIAFGSRAVRSALAAGDFSDGVAAVWTVPVGVGPGCAAIVALAGARGAASTGRMRPGAGPGEARVPAASVVAARRAAWGAAWGVTWGVTRGVLAGLADATAATVLAGCRIGADAGSVASLVVV